MKKLFHLLALLLLSTLNPQLSAAPLGTAFTYQGRLADGGNSASGSYDLKFTLYDDASGGSVSGVLTNAATPVTNGLFTVTLDFGAVFDGTALWLEIAVRTNGAGAFTQLNPRQPLTPAPFAFYALTASNAVTAGVASNLLGVLPGAQLAGNYSGALNFDNTGNSFSGNGAGLTALNANNLASGTVDDARLSANVALLNADQTFYGYNVFNLPLGIGIAPFYSLDVLGEQAVGRFTSTYNYFGSVIELQNTTTDYYPYMLGAINFNNSDCTYPGQIAYLTSDAMNFRVGGVDSMMLLDLSGLNIQGALVCNNLYLPATTANSGVIFSGGNPFIHAYGTYNIFAGVGAGNQTMTGGENTAIGQTALAGNQGGSGNTAVGSGALVNSTSGSYNIALGADAGINVTTGSNNIEIFSSGSSSDDSTIRIGDQGIQTNTFIAGIYGATIAARSGVPVYVDETGQLGTLTSSRKYKQDIRSMDDTSDALLALHPVTFRYKPDIDPAGIPQFGLVAEEVDKVNPDLVVRDEQHGIYTVRYEAVNAMLLNEFLKEHHKVQAQGTEIQGLKARLEKLEQIVNQKGRGAQ
jgi:Chaperone of endosialidase